VDFEHMRIDKPLMIDDNYLVIWDWVPYYVPEKNKIKKLMI